MFTHRRISRLGPGRMVEAVFVHGNIKDEKELILIESQGVKIIPFADVLNDLTNNKTENNFSGLEDGELIKIMNFMKIK